MSAIDSSEFIIRIDFNKASKKPAHVFKIMSELIESFNVLDSALISSIDTKIEPVIMLEDIEKGSLLSKFKYFLSDMPDEAVKSLEWKKIVGHYLIKAKYAVIEFINNRESINSTEELDILENTFTELSNNSQISELTTPGRIDRTKLLNGIAKISTAISQVEDAEEVSYSFEDNEVNLNLAFSFEAESIEELLTSEIITSTSEMILKIKKPDYLGDSKWEFRHRRETINARIIDNDWLAQFRNRQITLKPGDSIRANIQIEVKYDFDREVTSINHTILKVIDVIPLKPISDTNMF